MKADFLDAHERHWDDAEMLFNASRWANADHLYGLAAECGLKRLMMVFGMTVDIETGSPRDGKDRVHVMENRKPGNAWDRYEAYRAGCCAAAYVLPSPNPFRDWDASQRYAHRTNFDRKLAESHRQGADAVRNLVEKADKEGRL